MKKTSILSVLIILLFLLTACGTKSSAAATSTGTANSMASANELALGTLNLEGTSQAVSSKTAAQLLPLWQLLDELSTNASAAPQEISAVVNSIQTAMTVEQTQAIDNMQLTEINVILAVQGSGSANATGSTSSATASSAGADAVLSGAGGSPPDGGGIIGGSGPSGNSQQNTSISNSTSSTGTTSLIKQVIQLLQSKVQG